MIFAVIGVMSALGSITYLQVYQVLYDEYPKSPWLCFACIALFDGLIFLFLIMMIACGKFGEPAPGTVEAEEEELRGPENG